MFDAGSPRIPRGVGRLSMNEMRGPAHASNDQATDGLAEDFDLLASVDCRFEVYRKSEQRVSSTKFCGGDWCWRLVTTEGHILAEAAGYPNRGSCEVVVVALRKNAASAPVHILGDEDPR